MGAVSTRWPLTRGTGYADMSCGMGSEAPADAEEPRRRQLAGSMSSGSPSPTPDDDIVLAAARPAAQRGHAPRGRAEPGP